jgi:3alpha(or 20beta)-hydroxysteroid dehydrogenase
MKPNSVFFITGAAKGIGAATARLIVKNGHRAIITDIDEANLKTVARELGDRCHAIVHDVRDTAAWDQALNEAERAFGPVDVLLNNAAILNVGFVMDMPADHLREHFEVNVMGVLHGLQAGFKRMSARGQGHIINVASVASFVAVKGQVTYCASKHAVRAIHYGFVQEQRNSPIQFSIIHPGAVDTPMIQNITGHPAATLAFADPAVTAEQVAAAIFEAASTGKKEIMVPRYKNQILRLVGSVPSLLWKVIPSADAKGAKNMAEIMAKSKR